MKSLLFNWKVQRKKHTRRVAINKVGGGDIHSCNKWKKVLPKLLTEAVYYFIKKLVNGCIKLMKQIYLCFLHVAMDT